MINKIKYLVLMFIISGVNSLFAQDIKIEDGVKVIYNKGEGIWSNEPKIELEFIKTIGDDESGDENGLLYLPDNITKDMNGNYYILDSGNQLIKKYDPQGKYLLSFGGPGQGPGEFQLIRNIEISSDENIVVTDGLGKKFEIFSTDGKRIDGFRVDMSPYIFRFNSKDQIVARTVRAIYKDQVDGTAKIQPLLRVWNMDGKLVGEIGQHDENGKRAVNQFKFNIDDDDNILVSYIYQNKIAKYSPEGKLLYIVKRELNFEESLPEKTGGATMSLGGSPQRKRPVIHTITQAVDADSEGRIWNITLDRQMKDEEKVNIRSTFIEGGARSSKVVGNTDLQKTDIFVIEIFSTEGILLQKIKLDIFVNDMKIIGDHVYIVDSRRGMKYYEYRIIEK